MPFRCLSNTTHYHRLILGLITSISFQLWQQRSDSNIWPSCSSLEWKLPNPYQQTHIIIILLSILTLRPSAKHLLLSCMLPLIAHDQSILMKSFNFVIWNHYHRLILDRLTLISFQLWHQRSESIVWPNRHTSPLFWCQSWLYDLLRSFSIFRLWFI